MAQRIVDEDQVPGLSIAIVYQDEVVYLKGFGVREEGTGEAVDADTVFQLASLSKPLASTVVAALVGDKAVSWDSRIADIDPTFQLYEAYPTAQVTLRDLFAHRSGLPGSAGNELEELGYDRDTILHRLRQVKPLSSFRSALFLQQFRSDRGRGRRGQGGRHELGGCGRSEALQAARYVLDQLALRGLPHPQQPRQPPRDDRREMAGGRQARSRSAVTGRRGQLQCARPGSVDAARARQRQYNGKHLIDADAIGETHSR